jgi:hypothetical protein
VFANEGVKVTLITQLAPATSELPQVSATSAKSQALVPVIVRLLIVKVALPVLVSVTVWAVLVVAMAWLPKERLVGDRLRVAAVPVPERLAD